MQSKGEGERKKGIERAKEYDRGEGWRGGHAREERERDREGGLETLERNACTMH